MWISMYEVIYIIVVGVCTHTGRRQFSILSPCNNIFWCFRFSFCQFCQGRKFLSPRLDQKHPPRQTFWSQLSDILTYRLCHIYIIDIRIHPLPLVRILQKFVVFRQYIYIYR